MRDMNAEVDRSRLERERFQSISVFIVGTPWKRIPPKDYGGIENVLYDLATNLPTFNVSYRLHSVRTTADADTADKLKGEVSWTYEFARYEDIGKQGAIHIEARHTMDALKRADEDPQTQLIHINISFISSFYLWKSRIEKPVLITFHGPLTNPDEKDIYRSLSEEQPNVYFNSISDAQREPLPDIRWVGTVHNGINCEIFKPVDSAEKRDFLISLARISEDKGQHYAIEVAKRLGKKLIIAGHVEDTHGAREYFKELIKPKREINDIHLKPHRLELAQKYLEDPENLEPLYFGNAHFREKTWLLSHAKAFLNPIDWPEPFGLTMPEAMACGTPVIAFGIGSVPEIVRDGQTGFIVPPQDVEAMTEAVLKVDQIDPQNCIRHVRKNFSAENMALSYSLLYDRVLNLEEARMRGEVPAMIKGDEAPKRTRRLQQKGFSKGRH